MWVSPGFSHDTRAMRNLRRLTRAADAASIEVDALGGDVSWLSRPDITEAWAKEVAASGLFSRIHLDVEPHSMPAWSSNQARLVKQLLNLFSRSAKAGLPVDADIPYWYWRIRTERGERLDRAVMRRVDGVTIMAYQSSPSLVLAVAERQLAMAGRLKVPAYVGVNIGPTGGDSPKSSFAGQPDADVRDALATIDARCSGAAWCAGTAIHDAKHLAALTVTRPLAPRA